MSKPQHSHLVHVFPTFSVGGAQMICAQLINALGGEFRHTIVSLDGRFDAKQKLDDGVSVAFANHASKNGALAAWRWLRTSKPDLLLTTNWGSFDWVMAAAMHKGLRHVHQEHGFGLDESYRRNPKRNLARRLFLSQIDRLIVPSRTLATIAQQEWNVTERKLTYLPNGVDQSLITMQTDSDDPKVPKREFFPVIGTVAPLRSEKRIDLMIDAFVQFARRRQQEAHADNRSGGGPTFRPKLIIVGDGAERARLERHADGTSGFRELIEFTGYSNVPVREIAEFDVYAISSATEQMPVSVLQAMALGKPIAGFDVGDVKFMVDQLNAEMIVETGNIDALAGAFGKLAGDRRTAQLIGNRNQEKQKKDFDEQAMVAGYRSIIKEILE